jgi:hypothetical protein
MFTIKVELPMTETVIAQSTETLAEFFHIIKLLEVHELKILRIAKIFDCAPSTFHSSTAHRILMVITMTSTLKQHF